MTTLTRWRDNVLAPFDANLLSFIAPEMRIEQVMEDGWYVVRAELPGIDPRKNVEVTVAEGTLRIAAERTEHPQDAERSEFHYGRMVRTIALPPGAKQETATAHYAKGIIEIRVEIGEPKPAGRRIEIQVGPEPARETAAKAKQK